MDSFVLSVLLLFGYGRSPVDMQYSVANAVRNCTQLWAAPITCASGARIVLKKINWICLINHKKKKVKILFLYFTTSDSKNEYPSRPRCMCK